MPTTYTHHLFGKEVYQLLPNDIKEVIDQGKSLYLTGVHGPDILFYHKPYCRNHISDVGYRMHGETAFSFFEQSARIYQESEDPLLAAYLLGFVCHYILDSVCHPYVTEYETAMNVSHAAIETELDRFYKLREGKNPYRYKPQKHIHISQNNCHVISSVFDTLTASNIRSALKGMRFYIGLLVSRNALKRSCLLAVLKIAGCYDSLEGQVMRKHPLSECDASTQKLSCLFEQAKTEAAAAIINYWDVLQQRTELSERFMRTYE